MPKIKISAKVWEGLKEYERQYILNAANKQGLQYCKLVISEAKKQIKDKIKAIYGIGFVECENGNKYVFSGSDTKKFKQIN